MQKLINGLLIFMVVSCSGNQNQSIKLNVNNTVQIPVEYVTVAIKITEYGSNASSVELKGYENLSRVVNLLQENGIPKDGIEVEAGQLTTSFYNRESPFEFNSTLKFDITDLDKIDTYRRAIINAGGASFRISSYGNHEEDSIFDTAYRNAINVAKERAERLLSNQPVKVGAVLNLHENIQEIIEMVEIIATANEDIIELEAEFDLPYIEPVFNKRFYTRSIRFNVEFELLQE